MQSYLPNDMILSKYAEVLVNFALNSGAGVKENEVVMCVVPDIAKPLLRHLQIKLLEAGAHPMLRMTPTGLSKDFYQLGNENQLKFFPEEYLKARVDLIDHQIGIIAEPDPNELKGIDPQKLMLARDSQKKYKDWVLEKENQGLLTWTLALWGTEAKATEVGLSYEDYWQQIIKACFLDLDDPISKWKEVTSLIEETKTKLNELMMEEIHMVGPDLDITYKIGADRIWNGGSGRNIPSFELFTSPDWRGTNGWIYFNQPLYRYGNVLKGVRLEFKDGIVVSATAEEGEEIIKEMIKSANADKVGEVSLTDKRTSRIDHVMAETLFDENIGGPHGNTHMAIGSSYHDCYRGNPSTQKKEDWERMGFNDSAEHTDIISTTERIVTAKLPNGTKKVIYKNGMFTL